MSPSGLEVERNVDGVPLGPQEVLRVLSGKRIPLGDENRDRLVFARAGFNRVALSLLEQAMGIRRLHAAIEFFQDESELVDLLTSVKTLAARASFGDDLVVAVLPASERLRRNSEHLDDRADAVDAVAIILHPHRIAHRVTSEKV